MLLQLSVYGLLAGVAYQDFKSRSIYWWLPIAIFILILFRIEIPLREAFSHFGFNLLFFSLQLVLISIYFSIKHKKFTNIFDRYIGWGDILFFLPICLSFSPINFIFFYTFSLIVCLLGFLLFKNINKGIQTIPLAGGIAITLFIVKLFGDLSGKSFYNEFIL